VKHSEDFLLLIQKHSIKSKTDMEIYLKGLLNDPLPWCHFITTTTHKTLRGPRGGMIMMGEDFENPFGLKTPKGKIRMMSSLLDSAVFPGTQGGPLEHVIAAKAVGLYEALSDEYKKYVEQVQNNASVMAKAFIEKGYHVISGGTDSHLMLIDLRKRSGRWKHLTPQTGKIAENALIKADITVNKNMVPFDDQSPFVTSGMRIGTSAITTRGLKEDDMLKIVDLIDTVLRDHEDESKIGTIKKEVNGWMGNYPLFK